MPGGRPATILAADRIVDSAEERRIAHEASGADAADLESGAWDERNGAWREVTSYDGGLRLIVSAPGHPA